LTFNRSVVLRYRFFLEQKNLARSTINVRLAAVRRLAHEAADTGLLSLELAAGIGRVKGAKRLGVRIGNWLTVEQSRALLAKPQGETLRAKRVGRLGYGAQAPYRKLSGTSSKQLRNVPTLRISLRMTYAAPAHDSATWPGENLNRFSSGWAMYPFRPPSITWVQTETAARGK